MLGPLQSSLFPQSNVVSWDPVYLYLDNIVFYEEGDIEIWHFLHNKLNILP